MVPPDQAASLIGYVTMGMSLVPMIGPMIGGFLDETFGWQSVFVFTFVFGARGDGADLGRPRRDQPPAPRRASPRSSAPIPSCFRSRRFWGYALTAALASGAFFAFLGGGPWVATEVLGMSPSALGFHFGFIAARLPRRQLPLRALRDAGRAEPDDALRRRSSPPPAWCWRSRSSRSGSSRRSSFFGSILFVGVGNGLLLPSANAGIVSVRPHLAGSASGLGGALMIGGGAALSVLAGRAARARRPAPGRCSG